MYCGVYYSMCYKAFWIFCVMHYKFKLQISMHVRCLVAFFKQGALAICSSLDSFPQEPLLSIASDTFLIKFTFEYCWRTSGALALIMRRVRMEVKENWCQTSSFHFHPEMKPFLSHNVTFKLRLAIRGVSFAFAPEGRFFNQSNQASISPGNARNRVHAEAGGVSPPPSQLDVLEV